MNNKKTTVIVQHTDLSQSCDTLSWKFKTYISPSGRTDVQNEINEAHAAILQPFKTRVRYLANTAKIDWHEPEAKKLKGVQDIYEIRFKARQVQFRPLGYFGPGEAEFTILIWASKKGSVWDPAEAIDTAAKRRKQIISGEAVCAPLEIDGEEFPSIEE